MFRKGMLVAGSIMLAASFVNVQTVHAEKQIVVTQDSEAREAFLKIFENTFVVEDKPGLGQVTFDKATNKITATDVSIKMPTGTVIYKTVEVLGYKEDKANGDYSVDGININDTTIKFDQEALKKAQENAKGPVPPLPDSFGLKTLTYEGIEGSYTKKYVSIKKGTMSGLDFSIPGLPDFSKISGEFVGIKYTNLDKLKTASSKFMKMAPIQPNPNEPFPQEMLDYILLIYTNMSWEKISIKGFPAIPTPTGGSMQFSEVSLGKFSGGIFDDITLKGLDVTNPSHPTVNHTKIGKFALRGFDAVNLIKHASSMRGVVRPSPDQVARFFQFIKGLTLKDVVVAGPDSEVTADTDFDWNKFVGLYPTDIRWKGKSSIKLPPEAGAGPGSPMDYGTFLKLTGLDKLKLKYDMGIKWDEKENTVVINPFFYDADKLLEMNFSASIGNITRHLLEERDPNKISVLALGATAGPITLTITDKGAQKLIDEQTRAMWIAMSADLAADPQLQPVVNHITQMMTEPKGTLKITLKPKGEMSVAQLSASLVLGPKALPSLFDIESSFTK